MTNFDFNINIPDAPNNPSVDQPEMKKNFNSTDGILAEDHVSFKTNNGGFHKQAKILFQAGVPPGLIANSGAVYTKTATSSNTPALTETSLFYSPDTTNNQYQLSRTITASFASFSTNLAYGTPPATFTQVGGWTFLPGGILYQYGFFGKAGATGTSGQIQFPIAWAVGPTVFSINMTLYRTSGNQSLILDSAIPPTTTTFNFLTSSGGSDGIYWIAVGK